MAVLTVQSATETLKAHGYTVHQWDGYTIRRDIPPYSSSPDYKNGQRLERDWRSFHASNVSLHWLRKLAHAHVNANTPGAVTLKMAAEAWKQCRDAEEAYDSAKWKWNYGEKYAAERWTQQHRDNLGVAAIKAEGAHKVAERIAVLLREAWAADNAK